MLEGNVWERRKIFLRMVNNMNCIICNNKTKEYIIERITGITKPVCHTCRHSVSSVYNNIIDSYSGAIGEYLYSEDIKKDRHILVLKIDNNFSFILPKKYFNGKNIKNGEKITFVCESITIEGNVCLQLLEDFSKDSK